MTEDNNLHKSVHVKTTIDKPSLREIKDDPSIAIKYIEQQGKKLENSKKMGQEQRVMLAKRKEKIEELEKEHSRLEQNLEYTDIEDARIRDEYDNLEKKYKEITSVIGKDAYEKQRRMIGALALETVTLTGIAAYHISQHWSTICDYANKYFGSGYGKFFLDL